MQVENTTCFQLNIRVFNPSLRKHPIINYYSFCRRTFSSYFLPIIVSFSQGGEGNKNQSKTPVDTIYNLPYDSIDICTIRERNSHGFCEDFEHTVIFDGSWNKSQNSEYVRLIFARYNNASQDDTGIYRSGLVIIPVLPLHSIAIAKETQANLFSATSLLLLEIQSWAAS